MDIKEIALKVAEETDAKYPWNMNQDKWIVVFAAALIAEIAKQNEPVYAFRRKGLDDFCTCDKRRFDELSQKPALFEVQVFYRSPPTAEQIANETSWQPIETAPKGERFLTTTKLSNGSFGQVGISHSFFCYEVNTRDWKIAGDDPCATHWIPLPTPPKRSMEGV